MRSRRSSSERAALGRAFAFTAERRSNASGTSSTSLPRIAATTALAGRSGRATCITWTAQRHRRRLGLRGERPPRACHRAASRDHPVSAAGGRLPRAAARLPSASEILAHECGHTGQGHRWGGIYWPIGARSRCSAKARTGGIGSRIKRARRDNSVESSRVQCVSKSVVVRDLTPSLLCKQEPGEAMALAL